MGSILSPNYNEKKVNSNPTLPEEVKLETDPDRIAEMFEAERNINLNDFGLIRVLGRGSYGVVKLCTYKNKTEVALKSITIPEQKYIRRHNYVENEYEALLRCNGNQFPRFYKHFYSDDYTAHFVMEPVFGQNFSAFLCSCKESFLSQDVARFYLANIVLGLEKIHANNVIYKDLKPENIIVGEDGYLRLIDFGLCRILPQASDLLTVGRKNGTPNFLAPETVFEQYYGKAVDIWALGVLAFRILGGRYPFHVTNKLEKLKKDNFEPDYREDFTELSKEFIMGLLNKNQFERLTISQVKKHRFFYGCNFSDIDNKSIDAPFPTANDFEQTILIY